MNLKTRLLESSHYDSPGSTPLGLQKVSIHPHPGDIHEFVDILMYSWRSFQKMHITFYFPILKLALCKNIKHQPPEYNFTRQCRNQYFQGLRIFLNTKWWHLGPIGHMGNEPFCTKSLLLAIVSPHNIPVGHNLFRWAFSASRGQRNLKGSLPANGTNLRPKQHSYWVLIYSFLCKRPKYLVHSGN